MFSKKTARKTQLTFSNIQFWGEMSTPGPAESTSGHPAGNSILRKFLHWMTSSMALSLETIKIDCFGQCGGAKAMYPPVHVSEPRSGKHDAPLLPITPAVVSPCNKMIMMTNKHIFMVILSFSHSCLTDVSV